MRLDKYISEAAARTRSEAKKLILQGKACFNGAVCRKADTQVSEGDEILLFGQSLSHKKFVYIMLDKPKGVVSARTDKNDVTVVDLVKDAFPRRNLFPAGRLDKMSTGFVLLTDDGVFAHDILAPKKHVSKTYEVELDTVFTKEMADGFEKGVVLADGTRLAPAFAEPMSNCGGEGEIGSCRVRVVLRQGVYHQIKRMFGVYGAGVNELRRVKIGGLSLDAKLGSGGFRELSAAEVENITAP